ncbi:FAD dependent oxidoreductase-domain-containing protein [Mrakia frigida]|uniref:NAD(P)/FAD-dependent oxidoreductase n=1 Tax=Mrakia frigida TaxID=29902 RepID=UPI003FCC0FC6
MSTFPQPFISTCSHWQATNKGPSSLYLINKDTPLPKEADIVIVGGGMMGCALAYFLTRPGGEGEGKKVVLLEAKDIASGATGRNGGHVGPATYKSFHGLQAPLPTGAGVSRDEAARIIQAERDNLEIISEIIEKEGIAETVDFWRGHLCETHSVKDKLQKRKEMYEDWLSARRDLGLKGNGDTSFIADADEAIKVSRHQGIASCHLRPAGSVHSHKLCTALATLALASTTSDFSIHSWTPISSFSQTPSSSSFLSEKFKPKTWTIKTSKGEIVAGRLVLATNAHTKNFFPESEAIQSHIRPRLAQCALITPPPSYSGAQSLKHTYNMTGGYYLVQSRLSGGIILGGGWDDLVRDGRAKDEERETVNDSQVGEEWTKLLADYCKTNFVNWGEEGYGEGLTRVWTGILTSVKDYLPLVGEVPSSPGLFVSAGFEGHGMSRIFSCARALSQTLQTGSWDDSLLPRSFEITAERLERVQEAERKAEREGLEEVMISAVGEDGEERIRVYAKKKLDGSVGVVGGAEKGEKGETMGRASKSMLGKKEEEKGGWGCLIC